jgi:dTDP-4-amino-4,6-dideoxygalactose transaminase
VEVIEDNANGLFGKYLGKYLGTFGCLATLSFHETKNFTCGEGGALLINEDRYIERAEIIWQKGTNCEPTPGTSCEDLPVNLAGTVASVRRFLFGFRSLH